MSRPIITESPVVYDKDAEKFNCLCILMSNQNKILQDIGDNLRYLRKNFTMNNFVINQEQNEWHHIRMDGEGNLLSPDSDYDDYEWVLVKIYDSFLHVLPIPRIARYNKETNLWMSIDGPVITDGVAMWKPIPGTEWEDVFIDNKRMSRCYQYN